MGGKNSLNESPKKQILTAIRTENEAIGKRLACILPIIEAIRASQRGIDIMLTDLEAKLNKAQ